MSHQFTFCHGPGNWSPTPPHQDTSPPDHRLLRNVYFEPGVFFTEKQRESAANGILWLPLGSIVAAFASGHNTHPPADNLKSFVYVYKFWHQNPNKHCTMDLGWEDAHGNRVRTFGRAHVHQNGLEQIREFSTGGTLVRPHEFAQAGYDWHPPAVEQQPGANQAHASGGGAGMAEGYWTESDDEAEKEGWGR